MKLLIAALLALLSTSALAEWTRVGGNDNDNVTIYADLATIRKSGDKVKMWHLMDFKVVQTTDGKRYLSLASQNEYDCKEETARRRAFIGYSRNMGYGEVVETIATTDAELRPVSPGSVLEAFFKVACVK